MKASRDPNERIARGFFFGVKRSEIKLNFFRIFGGGGRYWGGRCLHIFRTLVTPTVTYTVYRGSEVARKLFPNARDVTKTPSVIRLGLRLGGLNPSVVSQEFRLTIATILFVACTAYFVLVVLFLGSPRGFPSTLAGIAVAIIYFLFLWRFRGKSWNEARGLLELTIFLGVASAIGLIAHGINPSSVTLGILGATTLRLAAEIVFYSRDLGKIYLVILDPGDPFPNIDPQEASDLNSSVLAVRLFSPRQRFLYANLNHANFPITVCETQNLFPRNVGGGCLPNSMKLDHRVSAELWMVCRYVLRTYMEAENEETHPPSEHHENREGKYKKKHNSWWSGARAAYFTSKLHLTQVKGYLLIVLAILASAWVDSIAYSHKPEPPTFNELTYLRTIQSQFYGAAVAAKWLKHFPILLAGIGLLWAGASIFYRKRQLERLKLWELGHRNFEAGNIQIYRYDSAQNVGEHVFLWHEIETGAVCAPVEHFGMSHEQVFHVVDAVMLVFLMELLHILHF